MASPDDSCTSCPAKLEDGQSQGTAVDSENFSTTENEHDNEHKGERGSFKNTTDNTELKRASHSGNLEVNGNGVDLERMSAGHTCSYVTVQIKDKIQSCLKKSISPIKKTVSLKTGHHSAETRQVDHRYDTESLVIKWSTTGDMMHREKFVVSEDGVYTNSAVKLASPVLDSSSGIHKEPDAESQNKSKIVPIKQVEDGTLNTHHVFVSSETVVDVSCPKRHPVITELGRELEVKLERISLPLKRECHNATSVDAKVSNGDVQMDRTVKTKSVLDTKDVRSPKKCKTVSSVSNKSVFTENRSVMKRNRHSKSKRSKSTPVIKRRKQFGLVHDCEVKLERLSPEFLSRALAGQKKQQSAERRSVTQMHQRYKTDNSFYFQKSSDTNYGTKEKIDGSLKLREVDGSFGMQIYDDKWGSDRIDAWGNVRYLLKGHNLSECEEDWCGWWVHFESFHSFCDAHLYCISDGVTESRIMVWDNPFEAKPTHQNSAIKVPEQTEYVHEESQDTKEEWAGWKVLCVKKKIPDVISFDFSDEEEDGFHGW